MLVPRLVLMPKDSEFDHDVVKFRLYRSFNGSFSPLDVVRRNRKVVPSFRPRSFEPGSEPDLHPRRNQLPARLLNLTPIQARTFDHILKGKSIAEIAREEGVSRSAIYQRIKGTRGRGGMISKNPWAYIWWVLQLGHDDYE